MKRVESSESIQIKKYDFDKDVFKKLNENLWVNGLWPLVYILSDGNLKDAYVGETADAFARMTNHWKNPAKNKLKHLHLITCGRFNKSATLDVESNLIKYISGDGIYKLLNVNPGLANHNYYQKREVYWDLFKVIWAELKSEGITENNLNHIDNSDLFKYSPYKVLSSDQRDNVLKIIKNLQSKSGNSIVVEGGAGTGKTILAIYLFKLLHININEFDFTEFEHDEEDILKLSLKLKQIFPDPSVALVVPMSSFRNTLKKVFKNIKGLNPNMVIGPAEVANKKYDILIVDEGHQLRRRVNLGAYFGAFDIASEKLNFDRKINNELDWILKQSKRQIIFYDENQSIKPSDVEKNAFTKLKNKKSTIILPLKSQFRVKGGIDYVSYIDKLLNCKFLQDEIQFESKEYEFVLFDSLEKLIDAINTKEREFGLSRLVAGYSWKWASKKKKTHDIQIDGIKLKWNSVASDWVNSANAINEVGCIHTTQGYDLNYTGVIFGKEITFDKKNNEIKIISENYHDINGKNSIKDPIELKNYIVNIYKTIMLRAIRGTYVYVCDENLRAYFKTHISMSKSEVPFKVIPINEVKPYINCVPVYDISVAAGAFSDLQQTSDFEWVELPKPYKAKEEYFVCKVVGDSMNKIIPNGSWCLFKKDTGGTREGKVVLVEHFKIQDSDFGAGYTVKSYHSEKKSSHDSWSHDTIVLKPLSYESDYEDIVLSEDQSIALKVVGIFVSVL